MKPPDALLAIVQASGIVTHWSTDTRDYVRTKRPRSLWLDAVDTSPPDFTWLVVVELVRNRDEQESPEGAAERLALYLNARAERWPAVPLPSLQALTDMANGGREW